MPNPGFECCTFYPGKKALRKINYNQETVKSPIRLVAIDIDGTLLDPHFQITPRNLQRCKRPT